MIRMGKKLDIETAYREAEKRFRNDIDLNIEENDHVTIDGLTLEQVRDAFEGVSCTHDEAVERIVRMFAWEALHGLMSDVDVDIEPLSL